ncbi:MAG TPA: TetR/AcrR family transcriptional regulator [Hyphomonadaceae bacterium]|nr:TetR/AcrR family transcriptional regulator [Hyphomonadaceae bacterium]
MPAPKARTAKKKTPKAAKKVRVPNAERSAITRLKLVEATIQCLHELGYHQTSTVVVTKRAKVSRGAMLHHFPSKADLMMAAMDYIREKRGEAHRVHLERFKTEREQFLQLIDVLWEEFQTPTGVARIELMLGSRNDPELRPRFSELNLELERKHKERIWARAEGLGIKDRKKIDAFVQLYAAALRGLAVDALWPQSMPDIKGAVALLKEAQINLLDSLTNGRG